MYNDTVMLKETFEKQMNFKNEIDKFNYFTRPKMKRRKSNN